MGVRTGPGVSVSRCKHVVCKLCGDSYFFKPGFRSIRSWMHFESSCIHVCINVAGTCTAHCSLQCIKSAKYMSCTQVLGPIV